MFSGNTDVSVVNDPGDDWTIGGEGEGTLRLLDGATLTGMDTSNISVGVFAPGTMEVSGGSRAFLPFNAPDGIYLGSSAFGTPVPPADGRVSRLLIDGPDTVVNANFVYAGGVMDSEIRITNGAVLSFDTTVSSTQLSLGPSTNNASTAGAFTARVHLDDGHLRDLGTIVVPRQNAEFLLENGSTMSFNALRYSSSPPAGDPYHVDITVASGSVFSLGSNGPIVPNQDVQTALKINVIDGGRFEVQSLFLNRIESDISRIRVEGEGSVLTGGLTAAADPISIPIELGAGGRLALAGFAFAEPTDPDANTERLTIELDQADVGAPARFESFLVAAGTLTIRTAPGFTPAAGDVFNVLRSGHNGSWSQIITPPLPDGLGWDLSQLSSEGSISVRCIPADLADLPGFIDLDDIDAFIAAFLANDPLADIAPPAGIIDLDDADAFIAGFLAGCP